MHPLLDSHRTVSTTAGLSLTAPLRPAVRPWLSLLFVLICGLAALWSGAASGAVHDAGIQLPPTAGLDGFPPPHLDLPLHQVGIPESDGETGRSIRHAAAMPPAWHVCAKRIDGDVPSAIASIQPARGRPCHTPPAHAPPALRRA
jgi:hypothetical protein